MLFGSFFGLLLKHVLYTTTEGMYFRTRSSTSPVSEPRQRSAMISSGKCCLLMTQQWRLTPRRNSSQLLTASHRPVSTSDWPSVWRRRMSWDRTHKHRRLLAFTTTNSMLSASSPTSAPPSLTTSHWTQRSTRGLGRQLQLSLVARLECGQAQAICEDKYGGLHCLCYQHIAVWQRYMDYIYAGQESRFNTFHLRSIRRILGISWLDKVTNADVLSRAGLPSMYTLLRQRRLRWLGHVRRMDDGRIPKYILYGELALGGEQPATLTFDIKMSAWEIWRLSTSTLCPERALQLIVQSGGVP